MRLCCVFLKKGDRGKEGTTWNDKSEEQTLFAWLIRGCSLLLVQLQLNQLFLKSWVKGALQKMRITWWKPLDSYTLVTESCGLRSKESQHFHSKSFVCSQQYYVFVNGWMTQVISISFGTKERDTWMSVLLFVRILIILKNYIRIWLHCMVFHCLCFYLSSIMNGVKTYLPATSGISPDFISLLSECITFIYYHQIWGGKGVFPVVIMYVSGANNTCWIWGL